MGYLIGTNDKIVIGSYKGIKLRSTDGELLGSTIVVDDGYTLGIDE